MKKLITNIRGNSFFIIGSLIIGLLLGWFFFHSNETETEEERAALIIKQKKPISKEKRWTCSMHPQIKKNEPGDCPICGMDLVPLKSVSLDEKGQTINEIIMTESALKLAEIQTVIVTKRTVEKALFLQGKIQEDERQRTTISAHFGGRIEKLFINFVGQQVKKGAKIATIYSPALVTAQREFLESLRLRTTRPSLYHAAKKKLKLWNLPNSQIRKIEEKGQPEFYFNILSPVSGTVDFLKIAAGDYVKKGESLFGIVNLMKVWALFDAYEMDLPWIKIKDKIEFTIQALPGKQKNGEVSFIDPFINPKTHIAKVRVELNNSKLELKPEMFITGILQAKLFDSEEQLLIPKTALLWTGKRAIVYVKVPHKKNPTFLYRELVLGPEASNHYVVLKGLKEGEEIAVNGVFKIDASAQLQGFPSMMNFSEKESTEVQKQKHTMFKVGGNCEMCKQRIESTALSVVGVKTARWESQSNLLHLSFDSNKVTSEIIQKAVAAVGHDTELFQAPDAVYEKLPGCCKYKRDTIAK